jgi:superfamily II DNA or RNA helicase
MNLRPYQSKIVTDVEAGWGTFRKQLAVCPTGGGKTIIFAFIASREQGRTLILAHREELIDQAVDKLRKATGIFAEKEKAEEKASLNAKVVVASVQTLMREARRLRWPPNHFSLIVCDEAHHSISPSWQAVLSYFSSARVLGVTATPDRGDKKNLGSFYENVAAEINLMDLVNDGYLSPISIRSIPLKIDLNSVTSVAGDFDQQELGHALEPYLPKIAEAIKEHASFRRVLAFLPLIATSQKFVEACRDAGLTAEHVDGVSDDRKGKLERFARWEFDVLSNAMLLTEGYDDCGIDCILCLRPTRSRGLFSQIVGRGTRICEGKENLLLLDFLWQHEKHSISRPAHLIAKSEEEAEIITKLAEEKSSGCEQPLLDIDDLATEAQAVRETSLAKKLAENKHRKATAISAEEFALNHHNLAVAEYEPTMRWESDSITEKQARVLKRARIDIATVKGKGHASKLIDLYFKDQKLTLATEGQRRIMRRMGHPHWETATADDARKFFAGIRAA